MPVKQIVLLMLENRSFDHMLGFSGASDFPINGLSGTEKNYLDALGSSGPAFAVSPTATYVPDLDPGPGHDFLDVIRQLHGAFPAPKPSVGNNIGFVADYASMSSPARAGDVMRCFAGGSLPVLSTLAREFAVCDAWFSSLPGPTWPNRLFAHCATSGGYVDGNVRPYNLRSIFDNMTEGGVNWRIYYHDIPQTLSLVGQRKYFATKYELFSGAFERDCKAGLLPQYSFIEPRYFNCGSDRANDQHPIHGVVGGELLIAEVYEAVRASRQWEDTLLVVTWDEHGGFYDHVAPPSAPPPDSATETFDFASYGVRVPAVVVSPLIKKGLIPKGLVYDHSSIPATARSVFGLRASLTQRDWKANTLDALCDLAVPRSDTPATLPRPAVAPAQASPASDDREPNDLQHDLLTLARELGLGLSLPEAITIPRAATESEAAIEVRAHIAALAKRL
jgi:phospholipase C